MNSIASRFCGNEIDNAALCKNNAPGVVADIFPGLTGEENIFVEQDAFGGNSIYIEVNVARDAQHRDYKRIRLATVPSGKIESLRVMDLDKDGLLDVEFNYRAQWGTEPPDSFAKSCKIYHKEFRHDVARALSLSLNQLYTSDKFASDATSKNIIPEVPTKTASPIESRLQRLEWDHSRLEREVRTLNSSLAKLEDRVAALENKDKTPLSTSSDLEDRVDDLESRIDDVESKTDDLEDRVDDLESARN